MRHQNKSLLRSMASLACEMCGGHNNNATHHIITRARQGGDYPWNLMTLCFTCHREWHDKGVRHMVTKWSHLLERLERRGFQFDEYTGRVFRYPDNGGEE